MRCAQEERREPHAMVAKARCRAFSAAGDGAVVVLRRVLLVAKAKMAEARASSSTSQRGAIMVLHDCTKEDGGGRKEGGRMEGGRSEGGRREGGSLGGGEGGWRSKREAGGEDEERGSR